MKAAARLLKLRAQVDALTLRERLMLFAGVLVVIGGLWEALLARPLEAREIAASAQIATIRDRLEQLDQAMELAARGIGDGMPDQRDRIRALEQQVAASEESIRVFTSDLVDPTQMREVLEELIERQRGLRLVRAGNLEVRSLIERDESAAAGSGEPMLYRHGLTLELEGSYVDCLRYLEAVERLPWRLYWGALQLETVDYPMNAIRVDIFTLSLEEDWIGV
jgi:MSHA biogenesis protein MshJ